MECQGSPGDGLVQAPGAHGKCQTDLEVTTEGRTALASKWGFLLLAQIWVTTYGSLTGWEF